MALFAIGALVVEIFDDGDIAMRITENRDFLVVENLGHGRNPLGQTLHTRKPERRNGPG